MNHKNILNNFVHFFISGAMGSGKSAIMQDLKTLLKDDFIVFDFDDVGVPENADKVWRQQTTDWWLQKIAQQKQSVCLLGQMVLGEILASPSVSFIDKVNFCFLDVSDHERIRRLKRRNTYGISQDSLNWASWLRMHHQDPQWEQRVIKENGWNGLNFCKWDALNSWQSVADVTIIDTTNRSVAEVACVVAELIHKGPMHRSFRKLI